MQAKVLIIEDEVELSALESLYLKKEGIDTTCVESAEKGIVLLKHNDYDLILLDINLPGIDGFEFLTKIRRDNQIPVIIVSAREADEDIIMGLGIGADEFVIKPFAPKVLVARVRAILRRQKQENNNNKQSNSILFDEFELIEENYCLKQFDKIVNLPTREFEILAFLAKNAGKVYSNQELYENIWNQEFGDISAVTVYIQRIRKRIEKDYSNPQYIKTIRSKGYYFNKEKINEK